MTPLAPHVTAFFQQRLPVERRASPHTSDSYAYAFKLLLQYASERLHVRPSALHLEQIDAPLVVAFLNHLEATRANRPSSRNVRLAAIKSFMHFLEFREPAALDQIRRDHPEPAIDPKVVTRHVNAEAARAFNAQTLYYNLCVAGGLDQKSLLARTLTEKQARALNRTQSASPARSRAPVSVAGSVTSGAFAGSSFGSFSATSGQAPMTKVSAPVVPCGVRRKSR